MDGVPLAERREQLKCGVAVVDLRSGGVIALLEFQTAVEEIFDVQLLLGLRFPEVIGFQQETIQHTFVVPPEDRSEGRPHRRHRRCSVTKSSDGRRTRKCNLSAPLECRPRSCRGRRAGGPCQIVTRLRPGRRRPAMVRGSSRPSFTSGNSAVHSITAIRRMRGA